jgi:serine phosphatase RsbU (regulator of sigma subunit)/HAMP domain-containing protein
MNFRFSIGAKILLGFGVLILLVTIAFFLTLFTIRESREINDTIAKLYTPSVDALQEMRLVITRSKTYMTTWVNVPGPSEDKVKVKNLIGTEYPDVRNRINTLSEGWNVNDRELIKYIFLKCDTLWMMDNQVMDDLGSFESYDDPSIVFMARPRVLDEDGDITDATRQISDLLDNLIQKQYDAASTKRMEMLDSFRQLQIVVVLLLVVLPLGGIFIALLTARTITKPVRNLKNILLQMARGVLPKNKIPNRNDEVGEMSVALNNLVDGMRLTTEFAREVGSGNFDSYYKPLSDEDSLGHALLKMRTDLRENERVLEAKVIERTEEVVRQKEEIEIQNRKLEILYKHITDSIRYAKRLQDAILPTQATIERLLPESFVLFKPKDIVSGDFYWLFSTEKRVFIAVVDCTGHGVPGAFMSIVAHNMLNQIVKQNPELNAADFLNELNALAGKTINQHSEESAVRDGMDMTMCILDKDTNMMDIAGANNPLYIFRNETLQEIRADKLPIGYLEDQPARKFTNHRLQLEKGDTLYLFSDGYADQFGGPKGKKFMVGQFRSFLSQIHKTPMKDQYRTLDLTIEQWRGNLEQVDDILVVGFRIL